MRVARDREARRELDWMCRQGLEWHALVEEADAVIRRVVPHERFCFHTFDPRTLLFTGGLARNLDRGDGWPRMVHNEYEEDDVLKWAALARSERRAGTLSAATGGRRERSVRYRELLRPQQLAWELRGSLVSGSRCWGAVGIYRSDGERDFADRELDFLAGVSASLAEGFRRSLVVGALPRFEGAPDGPGLILFDGRRRPVTIAPAAQRWLAELRGAESADADWLPVEVYAVAARARSDSLDARARVRAPSGRWLTLDGVAVDAGGGTAVIIQPARPQEIAPLILDSYGLTDREVAIAGWALQGRSTNEIAATAHLSPYTVQDHLKAIFAKTGVRSRRELVAKVFYEQHFPRVRAGERPGADGAFGREPLTRL
jgi:DNA-binding CsgD family transcriptional regulator